MGPNLGPILVVALIVIALGAGAFLFRNGRQSQTAAADAAPIPALTPVSAIETSGLTATPTPTLPVISNGFVPAGQGAAELAAVSPAPVSGSPLATAGSDAASTTPTATAMPATTTVAVQIRATAASASPATATPRARAAPAQPNSTSSAPTAPGGGPDLAAIAQLMLERVNADRSANGLRPVAWDATAAVAGQLHSEEMAQFSYMSHWNMDGYGPEYRYSRAGGLDAAQENVYRLVHQWQDGRGAPIDDWEQVVAEAETALMNSPGHRKNIVTPEHTHLGVGIAYNPATGNVAISQEFVNRYVTIEPLPRRAQPGDRIVLRGVLLLESTKPLVNLAYEPFPAPMTLEQLNKTGTYTPAAKNQSVPQVRVDANGRFVSEFALPKDAAPGLYHLLLWVNSPCAAEQVLSVDAIIEVNQ